MRAAAFRDERTKALHPHWSFEGLGGKIIAVARRDADISQRELARRSGVPQSAISAYEKGLQEPAFGMVAFLVKAAGMQLRTRIVPDDGHDASLEREERSALRRRAAAELLRAWRGETGEPTSSAIDAVEQWLMRRGDAAVDDLDGLPHEERDELIALLEGAGG